MQRTLFVPEKGENVVQLVRKFFFCENILSSLRMPQSRLAGRPEEVRTLLHYSGQGWCDDGSRHDR